MLGETDLQRDERYMRLALDEAVTAAEDGEIPVGAVVVCNGRVIARTHNLTERLRDVTAHAEMQAITAASAWLNGKYLTECTMYVTLEPCAMCAAAIGWSQLGRLVYGASDPKKGYTAVYGDASKPLHPRTEVATGLLADDCSEIMKAFFKSKRKK